MNNDDLLRQQTAALDGCCERFNGIRHSVSLFCVSVREFFSTHPELGSGEPPVVHSVRSRVKDEMSLRDKLLRKCVEHGTVITPQSMLGAVTDLAGVRVLHLHSTQFGRIHRAILAHEELGQWLLHERPKAYTWEPESKAFFEGLGVEAILKESSYTSVHYVVKPNKDNPICCEIQVRTLFEETWGEIDHMLNYPHDSDSIACREQLKVLAKLAGAGVRLVDAIVRSHDEHEARRKQDDGDNLRR